jgi:hypothetical protein
LFTIAGFSLERFLVSIFPASEKFDSDLELDVGMHKTDAHPCPPMNNNIARMPTHAHPKPMGTQSKAVVTTPNGNSWAEDVNYEIMLIFPNIGGIPYYCPCHIKSLKLLAA